MLRVFMLRGALDPLVLARGSAAVREVQSAFAAGVLTHRVPGLDTTTNPSTAPTDTRAHVRGAVVRRLSEAKTRYGSTNQPNLHYCEWIRGWTHTCLEIYGELAERNPEFLRQFDDEPAERVS